MAKPNAGFIGLGDIGGPMATHIAEAYNLFVYDINPAAMDKLVQDAGATATASVAELARSCETVGICVRDDATVESVLSGGGGLLANLPSGAMVAIHSTVRPQTVHRMAALAAEHGVRLIDAPMTGGAAIAREKGLTYMVGGAGEDLERYRPVLETSAKKIIHAGDLGLGMALKLCNNAMTYSAFIAMYESDRLARAAGLDPELLQQVGASNGVITDQMRAFIKLVDAHQMLDEERFQQHVSGFIAVANKDLEVALELAAEVGETLPGVESSRRLMEPVYRDAYRNEKQS